MRQLIKDYFLSILHKEATEQQIDLWLDHIETAADKAEAIEEMAESLLNQADEVRSILRIYQAVFDRVADSSGLTFWVDNFREVLQQNPNLTYKEALVETIRSWFQSDEYVARYGTDPSNEDFLSFLFLNILGRNADQEGYNYWLARLQDPIDPISREQLVIEFTESDEFKSAVDHEANAILQTAARLASNDVIDDLDYHVPDGNIHAGELSNEAPVDIISGTGVDENAAAGTPVTGGQLRAVDPDGEEAHVWKLLDDAGGRFVLDDENAQSPRILVADASKLDYEDATSHQIRVQVADRAGNTFQKVIPIAINDVNEAPQDLQVSNTEIAEQDGSLSNPGLPETVVAVLGAQDDDSDPLTYSIVASSLPGAFKIVGDLIVVAQPELIDAEAGVETVHLTVRATDPDGEFTQEVIPINVSAIVDEDPTGILPAQAAVAATAEAGFEIAPLVAMDPDTSPDSHSFAIANDPTGGAFAIDATGKRLILADQQKISSTYLVDGGALDADGVADGYVVVPVQVQAIDSAGNTYTDTIHVSVDQSGAILPFTDVSVEVLEGTGGNDTFTANAGYGPDAPVPGFNRTANAGDVAEGMAGRDTFVLTKQNNNYEDGTSFVSGVALNDIESVRIANRDRSPFEPEETLDIFKYVCTPCLEMPVMAPNFDDPVILEASLAPDIDHLTFDQSLGSVGVWDLQADFWTKDPLDLNDRGPVVDVVDVTGDFLWIDSDPQAKVADAPVEEIVFNLDEVLINGLLITENASGNEPGIQRAEQVGAIRLVASGIPSVVGSINNGPGLGGVAAPSITSMLTIIVPDLTGTRPTAAVGPAAAAANAAAIDFFAGQVDGIGDGLSGLEDVVIEGGGDVFMVFGNTGNDTDSDGDGPPLEIRDGAGSSFLFFERGGFSGITLDAGEGFDTVGVYQTDLNFGPDDAITGVERIKVVEGVFGQKSLHMFDDTTQEIVLAGGLITETAFFNIPNPGGTTDQAVLCREFGEKGFVFTIDQCCFDLDTRNDHLIPDRGDFRSDIDLFLDIDGSISRLDLILNIDPGNPNFVDDVVELRNLAIRDVSTLHVRIEDCDDDTDGIFEIGHLSSQHGALQTLLLSDDGNDGTTRILQDFDQFDKWIRTQETFFRNTPNLSLINGADGVRNQEFLRIEDGDEPPLKFLPVLEKWGDDFGTVRPGDLGFQTFPGRIADELVVSDDGAVVNLGEGNDLFTGNRLTADGTPEALGADFVRGNGGNDLIFGAAGNDQIEGGSGDDELQGEAGDDCIWGDEGDDLLNGGSGSDYVDGGVGDDVIFGGIADDLLRGGDGDDAICGDDGDDCLFGEDGNDLLIGGRGADFLDAGASGTDVLIGDYNCEPCYVDIRIPAEIVECDTFTIKFDQNNGDPVQIGFQVEVGGTDGAREFICESEISLSAGGWLEALVDGASYQSLYMGSTEATIDHFVATWGPAIAADTSGYVLSRDGNKLVMTANSPPDSVPVVDIAPGDPSDTIGNTKIEKIYETTATAPAIATAFETMFDQWIAGTSPATASSGEPECWDVFTIDGTLTICKVGERPTIEFTGIDAAIPALHVSELDAQIGSADIFSWDVSWFDGGPLNQIYEFRYDSADLGAAVSGDGIVDTVSELKALAQLIADDFNNVNNVDPTNDAAAAALRAAGFSMVVGDDGRIGLIGPDDKSGQTPAVVVSATNGDPDDDDTQSLDEVEQIEGTPPIEKDLGILVESENKSEASQDVFVASARTNDAAAFAADGYDNDLMPQHDFRGLMKAAGLEGGDDGEDGGVAGVVYVLDFNQGNGLDDLSTWHLNEAVNRSENTDPGSATGMALKAAFEADVDRIEGDKLAFRKSDGQLDECGTAANYSETENSAVDRDDADAGAVNAFGSNGSLRYHVSARTFEDALQKNHGLIWGVDIDQADVDTALADLDDGFDANDIGGIWSSSLHLIETITAAKSESWLRVYYNEAGTDAAPEAVMELVGLDSKAQISFKDIVGADCIVDCDVTKDPVDICDPFIL